MLSSKARELGKQPAFPRNYITRETHRMGTEPYREVIPQPDFGLTKREYFAGLAMNGLQSSPGICNQTMASLSGLAVKQADALLEELAKDLND